MNTETPMIREAVPEDAALLAILAEKAFREAFAALNSKDDFERYVSDAFTQDRIASEIRDENSVFFIATVSGERAGYAKLSQSHPPQCVSFLPAMELARLYALKPYWGCGIGPALMETCLAYARRMDFKAIWLGSWKQNHRGNAFYAKNGFGIVGETTFALGGDIQEDHIFFKMLG